MYTQYVFQSKKNSTVKILQPLREIKVSKPIDGAELAVNLKSFNIQGKIRIRIDLKL